MKNAVLFILPIFLVLTSFIGESSANLAEETREDISWLNGNWEGLGYQPNIAQPWDLKLSCNVNKKSFIIEYPSLNCKGFWKVVSTETNRVIFKETIAKGEHTCIPKGKVIVTRVNDKHISYSYFEEIEGKDVLSAFSTLTLKNK